MIPTLTTYGGLLHDPGYAGADVDQNEGESINLMNDQATAIQFGYAVARSAKDELSQTGSAYPLGTCKAPTADTDVILGIAQRWAIRPAPGYGQTSANVVQFAQNDEVPIKRRGRIYAVPVENVKVDSKVISITAQNGALGGASDDVGGAAPYVPAVKATGSVLVAVNPTINDTITMNGTAFTFVAASASATQVTIGATAVATATNLAAKLAASVDAQAVKFTYSDTGTGTVEFTAATAGTGGNALTLAVSNAGSLTLSGATLAGGAAAVGTAGRVVVPGATWETTTAAGSLGIVRLNGAN